MHSTNVFGCRERACELKTLATITRLKENGVGQLYDWLLPELYVGLNSVLQSMKCTRSHHAFLSGGFVERMTFSN